VVDDYRKRADNQDNVKNRQDVKRGLR
jgi:hypothetical protein